MKMRLLALVLFAAFAFGASAGCADDENDNRAVEIYRTDDDDRFNDDGIDRRGDGTIDDNDNNRRRRGRGGGGGNSGPG